ncbi:flagellar motor switch protein FliG [Polynucleobacter sp. MWH-UH35A]|uniref:flagellar motor switch protein FliG n=1 Tax=Polynucleobacter sp. MWH-UH35A TaxID=1855619 RepID=UPI001BFEA9F7|nr:flagellar motor switch protein FliG [Polynucleobacter sp. MWH-UH35A]QWD59740.1 flagellar motor switch protein FliG [Polynucleobacter sp. MWH-UH35A]
MADEEVAAPKSLSIAEALKEGVKSATQTGALTFEELDGASRAAVVLLAVGAESAANVLRTMTPFEVQRLSGKMAVVRSLSRDLVLQVLRQFKDVTQNNSHVAFDTDDFMQNMLTKAMGAEGASDLLGRLESTLDMSGIETLKRMEPDVLYEMIKGEHPQIVATVMVFLEPGQAASVLKLFPDDLRNELILRIALLEKVQPAALKELNEVMSRSAGPDADFRRSTVGGVVPTAEILNMLSGGLDKQALKTIHDFNAELADAIQEKMFVFEDFNDIEDRSLQTLLLEVPQETLVMALKGASPKLREKLFKNMAKRAADGVREDLETRPPVKVQEVEEMQKEVIRIARTLAEEGRMIMERGKSADAFL